MATLIQFTPEQIEPVRRGQLLRLPTLPEDEIYLRGLGFSGVVEATNIQFRTGPNVTWYKGLFLKKDPTNQVISSAETNGDNHGPLRLFVGIAAMDHRQYYIDFWKGKFPLNQHMYSLWLLNMRGFDWEIVWERDS